MKYILWGVGSEKNDIRDYALDQYGKDVMYFVDNAPSKQGIYMCETGEGRCINVFSPDVLKTEKEEFELIILCMNKTNIRAIQKQIEDMNISPKINLLDDFRRDYPIRSYLRNYEYPKVEHLVIETSSYCNLECEFCNFHGDEKLLRNDKREAFMTWPIIYKLAEQAKNFKDLKIITFFHSGEEFLNPEWQEMFDYILSEVNPPKASLSTNGMLLNKTNIEKINMLHCEDIDLCISLTGHSVEECEKYRKNINYEQVKSNIKMCEQLLKSNVHLRINLDCMVNLNDLKKANYMIDEVYMDVPQYIKEDFENVDCIVGPTFIFNPDVKMQLEQGVKPEKVSAYYSSCINVFNSICIDSQGYVLNCCCNGGYIRLGNIMEGDMYDIWANSNMMKEAREKIVKTGVSPDFCSKCGYQNGHGEFYALVQTV